MEKVKSYEEMSDYEKAVANRDAAPIRDAEVVSDGKTESASIPPGGAPSNEQLAAGLISLENALRSLGEVVNKNAKMSDDNFAGMGKHLSDVEAKVNALAQVTPMEEKTNAGNPSAT